MIVRDEAGRRSLAWQTLGPAAVGSVALAAGMGPAALAADGATQVARLQTPPTEIVGLHIETGRRTEEPLSSKLTAPLLDTPKSVVVIEPEVLSKTAALTLEDALRTVPGITFGSGEGGTSAGDRPIIRGIESTNDIFVDGIRDAGTQSRETFAVDHIEILKGPGSAYTGRGSTGGSINLVSKTPKLDDFATASGVLGTDETKRATVDLNHRVTESVAVRLAAMYHDAEVAGRDAVTDERWGFAPSVAFGLGTRTRGTVSYYYVRTDGLPDYGIPYDPRTLKPVEGHDDDFYGLVSRDFRKTKADIANFRFEHDVTGSLRFQNNVRYGRTGNAYVVTNPDDSRGNVPNGYVLRNSKNRNVVTETWSDVPELRGQFETGAIKHSFSLGAEFTQEKTHSQGYFVNGPGLNATAGFAPVALASRVDGAFTAVPIATTVPSCTPFTHPAANTVAGFTTLGPAFGYNCTTLDNPNPNDPWIGTVTRSPAYTDTKTTTRAFYLFDTIEFSPKLSLSLGVRHDDFDTKSGGITATATTTAPYVNLTPTPAAANKSKFWNVQAGATYKPRENGSIYVSYGTSSNPSGEGGGDFSTVAPTTQNLAPEDNKSYELGTKWELARRRLSVTAAIFRTDKTNARVTDALGNQALIGKTRVDGAEIGFSGMIAKGWSVFGGYTYLDSEIIDGGFASGGTAGKPSTTPNASTGKRLPNTPKHAFTLWTTYDLAPQLQIGGGAQAQSKRYGDAANTRQVDGYWRFDAMAAYRLSERVDLQLNVQNLTDERYALRPYTTHMVQIAPGRTALLTINLRY